MTRPTISDVAQIAGVSKSTVSRVLTGHTLYLRPETKEKVRQAITQLSYRPSLPARSLTSKRTCTAAILISDISNPFYAEVIRGVEEVAQPQGYDIFLCNTHYSTDRGLAFIRSLADKQVDGVLIMSSSVSDEWVLELANHHIPTVVLDWEMPPPPGQIGLIKVDFDSGIQAAVDHLVTLGHRHLAHLSGPLHLRTSLLRREAFLKAVTAHGLDPAQTVTIEGDLQIKGGQTALAQILALPQPPTAIFAANDLMALGLIRAARAQGLTIPHHLSLIGLDDIWLAADMEPPLTTVALPRYELGRLAMQMLFNLLENERPEPARQQVSTHLVLRQSTAPPL